MGFKKYLCEECTLYYPQHVMQSERKCVYCHKEIHDSEEIRNRTMAKRKELGIIYHGYDSPLTKKVLE